MYTMNGRIRYSECDAQERLTIPGIINYFQDCSTFQSEKLGRGVEVLKSEKRAWLLSSWQIVIERCPSMGEEVTAGTWATDFKGFYGTRNFMLQTKEGERLAYANSIWAYIDTESGHPVRLDEREVAAYGKEPALEMEYAPRKIKLPTEMTRLEPFPVRRYQIDTNNHVNNSQYVAMALEVLPEHVKVRQIRVEYQRAAVYGDRIVPKTAKEEKRIVTALCDLEEKPYAIVELTGE